MTRRQATVLAGGAVALTLVGATTLGQATSRLVLPRGSVGTAQLKDGAVTGAKVRNRSLEARDFRLGALPRGTQGPPGPRGEPGPSVAFSRSIAGPVSVPPGDSPAVVATLEVAEPGEYLLMGKAYFMASQIGIPRLSCQLIAGEAVVDAVELLASNPTPVAFLGTRSYAAPGTLEIRCTGRGETTAHAIALTALLIGRIASLPSPPTRRPT
jgi:hypothetical protein